MPKLIYSLEIVKKYNKCITTKEIEKMIDKLRDQSDTACRAFDESGNFSGTIDTDEYGYIDLEEFSMRYPEHIFNLTYIDNSDMKAYKTIYDNGVIRFLNGKISFDEE